MDTDTIDMIHHMYPDRAFSILNDGTIRLQEPDEIIQISEFKAKKRDLYKTAKAWQLLRTMRDLELAKTDWYVIKAMEEGKPLAAHVAAYRKALRDHPKNVEMNPDLQQGVLVNVKLPQLDDFL